MAEYEALLHGMRAAREMSVARLKCYGDSDLVAGQTTGTCDAVDANMIAYRRAVDQLGGNFAGYSVEWIDRRKNEEADALSRIGWSRQSPPPGVFFDVITKPSITPPKEIDLGIPLAPDPTLVAIIGEDDDWTHPYIAYLEHRILPKDETEARMIVRRCKSFVMIDKELYKRSVSGVFQRCVSPEEGRKILYDIHAGDCGNHAAARSLVAKALRHGFYWLSAHEDAVDIVRRCAGCQKYANQTHLPSSALKTIPITWPFAVWGLDMVGKFKRAPGGFTHLLVAVDKFTKWVEAKPIRKCDGKTATKFLRELIHRYGFPHSIITDNGTNFAKGEMAEFCREHHIRLDLASVAHPVSNGQAERANQSILHGLKPRLLEPLERAAGCWVEELPSVLWGIRTSENRSTGFTPFFMVYGAEAVMPTDLEHDSPRVVNYVEEDNEVARQNGLDIVDEARDLARSRTAIYQQGLRRYHSRRVRTRTFQEGDLVLRLIQDRRGMHKLSPPWEGPFAIGRVLGNDSYYLIDVRGDGQLDVQRPWNVDLLRKYYT
jgi:transposase InsO family protein